MQIKRHFLGWDGPIVEKVSGWLLEGKTGTDPVDLYDTIIVVPTLQAGRRLREVLALHCHERQSALLSATIVTPHHFFTRSQPGIKVANAALTQAVWTHVLEKVDLSQFSVFFPQPKKLDNLDRFQWALTTGEIIERLRQELADGGYSITDVIRKHESRLEELDRWKDMAGLEKLYLHKLNEFGFSDSCNIKMSMADNPELKQGVTRIVLAGTPDPTLLAIRALENLSRDHSVDILIHAPKTMANSFDDWGRPIPGVWVKEKVDIPDWDKNVFLEASPDTQGRKVVKILSGLPAEYGPADIGIGVPDPAVIPFLKKDLRAIHLPAFDPADARFKEHSLGRLVDSMSKLLLTRAYAHVADLLRHPDFLCYLDTSHKIPQTYILTQLDKFQNYYLPVTLEEMLAPFNASEKGISSGYDDFSALGNALKIIKGHVDEFENKPASLEESWRLFLQSVYDVRKIKQDITEDREFQQAAEIIEQTLREFRDVPAGKLDLNTRLSTVFVRRLQKQTFHRERADEILDLQGWLELPWTDTPFLVITGLNEEFVPGGNLSDVFLPDNLRKILELRDDFSRFGRDVYLLKALVESRRQNGRLCVIAGKHTLSSDPLRPSRLLFRCSASQLPDRAEQLFKTIEQAGHVPAAETIFQLKPAAAEKDKKILEDKVISVTAFSDYLTCPFRFYLKHILRMKTLSDDKNEMDALDFGTVVHKVLQIMGGDKDLWACRDAGELGKKLAGLADQIMAGRYGENLPLAALVALSSARARLEALAREQVELAGEGWEIIATEQKKAITRKGFTITGKIDRVDQHNKTGIIRIIDYKTSDNPNSPQTQHLKNYREGAPKYNQLILRGKEDKKGNAKEKKWVNLQLPLYRLLYDDSNTFNPMFELAYFNLPKAVSETGISQWCEFNNGMMASAIHCVEGVLDDIARGIFWPPTERVEYDDDFEMLFLNSPDKAFDTKGFSS